MKRKITASLGRDGVMVHIPLEVITKLLQPRVMFGIVNDFTAREDQVLKALVRGLANKEIAKELSLSERTVKFHVSSLLAKTKTKSRFDLLILYSGMEKNGESK
jgi:DNA-binding NarL/FixJ family response regulator